MADSKPKLQVSAIKNGTVIDHIPAKHLFKVISILNLEHIKTQITFGTNLESKKLGYKAIIKLSKVFFKDEDINKIALIAPHAKLNIIKDFNVTVKRQVEVPDQIKGIAKCGNPNCITNNDNVNTIFYVIPKDNEKVVLKCHYCEKITDPEDMEVF
ncbi:MAG: aspartate carbamoyltransferase regulatory subunit [Bacteroidales bacterium]|nr:aspartate carbamoyltransferase regulatory subunit [Bacteroidales bacterium]